MNWFIFLLSTETKHALSLKKEPPPKRGLNTLLSSVEADNAKVLDATVVVTVVLRLA